MDIFEKLSLAGLVPVIKVEDANDAVPLCRALSEGGLPVAEITFRTAAAEQAIRNVSSALPEVILGAGTVLYPEEVRAAKDAGCEYIIAPNTKESVIAETKRLGMLSFPGAMTPTEICQAWDLGADMVKL